jgi:integrase
MPAKARGHGHVRKLPSGKWQLRYYDSKGVRHSGGAFPTRSEAWSHYRDVVEPELHGRPAARRDLTLSELVDVFLERHAIVAKPRTISELRWRLKQSEQKFGDIPLAELEGMADEIAGYAATISERLRYPLMAAFRQALEAGIRYGYLTRNPAKLAGPNPMPTPREIRVYTPDELKAIVDELDMVEGAAVRFAAATGLRPAEWASVERRDVDQARRLVFVRGTKTARSRREVPLTAAALSALDDVPPRIDSRYVFTTTRKCPGRDEPGPFDVANFRRRVWAPAIESSGIARPARIYDLRSTFISNALASGLTIFEVARVAGTSPKMIELHYGSLLDSARESLLERLEAPEHMAAETAEGGTR